MKFLLFLSFFFLVSCNGGGEGGGSSSSDSLSRSHLGVWFTCEGVDSNDDSINDYSILHVMAIDETSLGYTRTTFSLPECTSGDEEYKFGRVTSYTRDGDNYETTLRSETYTPLSAFDVSWDNSNSWCGLNNWQINVPQSILGRTCQGEYSAYGDISTGTFTRSGNTLIGLELSYFLGISGDLSPRGETIVNGTYAYSDGVSNAIMVNFNSGNYTVYYYDIGLRKYTVENGTYTSTNNVVTFNASSSSPLGCSTGTRSRRFSNGELALTIELAESDLILYAMKVTHSESHFRNEFLGGGFSIGCIF